MEVTSETNARAVCVCEEMCVTKA